MSFQSLSFLLFFVVTVGACLLTGRKNRTAGLYLLAAACAVFCLLSRRGFVSLWILLFGCRVTRWALKKMQTLQGDARRRALRWGCAYHIAVLMAFKYTGFFTGGAFSIGWAPIGLSFFTFQQLWLLKEVYTGGYLLREDDSVELFALFFPVLTSGPILKPQQFFDQLRGENFLRPDWQDAAAGVYAICCGTMKKVLLADSFGVVVNNGWSRLGDLSAPAAWLVMLGYTLQLYFDFSGYCDIAAGCARLLGLRLPINFDSPYRSFSVSEFWKRWHITLTSFLRECVYIPLGGSRKGAVRTYLHILIVYLVSGFWHGAGWTFILWGVLHGLAQIWEKALGNKLERIPKLLRWCGMFLFVTIAWVFFRAPSVGEGVELLRAAVSGGFGGVETWLVSGLFGKETSALQIIFPSIEPYSKALRLGVLYLCGMAVALYPKNTIRSMEDFRPTLLQGAVMTLLTLWAVLSFSGVTTFIYSNF